jgi:hypothetical protein
MRTIPTALLFCLFMIQTFATKADELRPVQSGFTHHTPQYHMNIRKVLLDPNEQRKTLSVTLVERIQTVWQTMLLRTRHLPFGSKHRQIVHQDKSKVEYSMTFDGVSAVFLKSVEDYGNLSGSTRNPEKDTKPEVMMRLGKAMIDYVLAPKEKKVRAKYDLSKSINGTLVEWQIKFNKSEGT